MKHHAFIQVTPELLRQALNLKDDIEIIGIYQFEYDTKTGSYSVKLQGDSLPTVSEGCMPMYLTYDDVKK
jgi:hypothetical protein